MKVKFLGAAGTVTGSGYVLTNNQGEQILIDLGMFQGPSEIDDLNFITPELDGKSLSAAILTHAHLDHCGRLPLISQLGFKGKVYMTQPTIELTRLSLLDSAKISKENHPEKPLYTISEVEDLCSQFSPIDYNLTFQVGGFTISFRDAGHIIGSATIEVVTDSQKIVFSGDLGNSPEDLTKPTQQISSADFVVMESTYGDRLHPHENAQDTIRSEITTIESTGGTLLIPAFSLERTQELLHIISHLKHTGAIKPETAVYLDSPMAEKATNIYIKYSSYLNDEIKAHFKSSDPFSFPGLQVIEDRRDSGALNDIGGPKVIIAGGGMMTGGRIVNHAKYYLPIASTRLLIVGYQGEGTLGRQLLDGQKRVVADGQEILVNAHVSETRAMSSHADQNQLLSWLQNISGVKRVVLTHGEEAPRLVLKDKISSQLGISDISTPHQNDQLDL